ncbi:MAG: nucleoside recognition protein [Desulfobacterales bacterium]|jgi:hypothetical protein
MAHHRNKGSTKALLLSLALSAAVLMVGVHQIVSLNVETVLLKLFWPLFRLMMFITAGLLIGQIIEATGWTRTLAVLARPLFRFGNLGNQCSAAFTTAFFSGVTANALLLDFLREAKISRRQLYLSNFINQLPAFFLHLPTTFFIVIPLTGLAGVLYFLITFLAVLFRTILFLLYGHFFLPSRIDENVREVDVTAEQKNHGLKGIGDRIKLRLPQRLIRIAIYVVPIYTLVFVLNALGVFQLLREGLADYVVTTFMPMESLSVIILSFAAEFTSGFAAAGALLDAGVLTIKQTVIALLIGNILAFPVRALRHQLPRYIGIFSPKMGTQILLMGQGFRVVSIIFAGVIYYYVG